METTIPEAVKQVLRKIHTLTLRGVGGEAKAAKLKLDELLKKYGITLEDVVQDLVKTYRFKYRTSQEQRLIIQCYVSIGVENPKLFDYSRRGRKLREIGLDMTPAQYVDLQGIITYYKAALAKEQDLLFRAFIQRHKLYPPPEGEGSGTQLTHEELEELLAMMRGLGVKSYFKPAGYLPA